MNRISLREQQAKVQAALEEDHVVLQPGRPLPVSLTPLVINALSFDRLVQQCEAVLGAIETFLAAYQDNEDVQSLFPELEGVRALTLRAHNGARFVQVARFDVAQRPDGHFQLMETNCDCPGGIYFLPTVQRAFRGLPVFEEAVQNTRIRRLPMENSDYFVRSIVSAYGEARPGKRPNIAFLSSRYRPILTDLNKFEDEAQKLGFTARHTPVQDLQLRDGVACFDEHPIDLAYQKFDAFIDEQGQARPCIYEHSPDEVAAYWHGLDQGQFVYFNSFASSFVAENKRILSLLPHPDFAPLFTSEQRAAIASLIPEGFMVRTSSDADRLLRDKRDWVLKRVIDTRGRGVVVGRFASPEEWAAALAAAQTIPMLAQRYIPHQKIPILDAGDEPALQPMFQNIGVYLLRGKVSGILCRASMDPITNIARQGAMQPVLVKDEPEAMSLGADYGE